MIEGEVRIPKTVNANCAGFTLDKINGTLAGTTNTKSCLKTSPLFPKEQMRLERDIKSDENITGRVIGIVAPIGKGQQALIVRPRQKQKTVMMQHLPPASSNHQKWN